MSLRRNLPFRWWLLLLEGCWWCNSLDLSIFSRLFLLSSKSSAKIIEKIKITQNQKIFHTPQINSITPPNKKDTKKRWILLRLRPQCRSLKIKFIPILSWIPLRYDLRYALLWNLTPKKKSVVGFGYTPKTHTQKKTKFLGSFKNLLKFSRFYKIIKIMNRLFNSKKLETSTQL